MAHTLLRGLPCGYCRFRRPCVAVKLLDQPQQPDCRIHSFRAFLDGGNGTSTMAHFDGSAWGIIDSGLDSPAQRITGLGSTNLWHVRDQGAILRQRR